MDRYFAIFGVLSLLLVAAVSPVFAYHQKDVLGVSNSALPQIPPTSEGPGLILPDSPLFFLDEFKQNVRLMFAFSPEAKAKVHASVAGERLAELRFMLAKNNEAGIEIALQGVSENLDKAAEDINNAKLSGKDVSALAKSLNTDIKEKQESLSVLEAADNKEVKFKAKAAQAELLRAKVAVEDVLPTAEFESEIENDIANEIEDHVEEASGSARGLEHAISVLDMLASQAAQKQQTRREEALRHAIEVKSGALQKQQENVLAEENKKQETMLQMQKNAAERAKKAAQEVHAAGLELQKVNDMRNQPVSESSSGSSGFSSSGSSQNGDLGHGEREDN